MVGFLTLKAGCSPHGPLSEATLKDQSKLCVRICGSGKTRLYSDIDEEKRLPQSQRKLLICPLFFLAAIYYYLLWSRTITIRESECDPEKHRAAPSVWTSFLSTLWSWHYANAAGCWHSRHGLDTIWLLLLCYSLTWLCSIVSFSNSNKACCPPCACMLAEFYWGKPAGTHRFGGTDLNYCVVNEC